MRAVLFFVLLLSSLLFDVRAEAANCAPTRIGPTTGENSFIIDVPEEEMRRSPMWLPGEGEPPLLPWRAARILQDWAEHAYVDQGRVTVNVIELRREFCQVDTNRWYYLIQFVAGAQGRFAIVLMNGRLFPPRKSPLSDLSN